MGLEIHCWGGFGSQLFAWLKVLRIKEAFPNRTVTLIFHSSGVTERPVELNLQIPNVVVKQISDFHASPEIYSRDFSRIKRSNYIFGFCKTILTRLGFIVTEDGANLIKPWTLQIRSHYSYEIIPRETLLEMFEILKSQLGEAKDDADNLPAIQYRLGDLTTLPDKSPIDTCRFARFVEGFKALRIYSDSPELAARLFNEIYDKKVQAISKHPWGTILDCVSREHFLGTNSKISIWIALIRAITRPELVTWMPIELSDNINKLLGEEFSELKFEFY